MTVTITYRIKQDIVLSHTFEDAGELASFEELFSYLRKNPWLWSRLFLCDDGLVSTLHGGTLQYAGNIKKHPVPLWLAAKDFRGTIDFYYSQFEWPFQIQFQPHGFLKDFVINRIEKCFVVPGFTRQILKLQSGMSDAHQKYAKESLKQVRKRIECSVKLSAR